MVKKIKILGREYDFEMSKNISNEYSAYINSDKRIIIVDPNVHIDERYYAIAHEAFHGILDATGYKEHSKNEGLIEALATGFMSFIRDNKELIKEMQTSYTNIIDTLNRNNMSSSEIQEVANVLNGI